jgi:hypothetical protein
MYMQAPPQAHLQGVCSIIRYVNGTVTMGLFYPRTDVLQLIGFSDADGGGGGI